MPVKLRKGTRPPNVAARLPKQVECDQVQLASGALHFLTFGGGRSTKTFRNVRLTVTRAILAPGSRHAFVRSHLRHIRSSVRADTLPKVMRLCFPGVPYRINKAEDYAIINTLHKEPSEIWLFGLDDPERSEKILGMEFATIFFNEVSQLSWKSVSLTLTRLAQNVNTVQGKQLPLMALYDCNPPKKRHWCYKVFIEKTDPDTGKPLSNPEDYAAFQMNPRDNPLLPEATKRLYQNMSAKDRLRFWEGEFGEDVEGALWSWDMISAAPHRDLWPDFRRIVVAVDPPATTKGVAGVIVVALGIDGKGYVLADRSVSGEAETWAKQAVKAYHQFSADCIVGEVNQGGDMVRATIHAVDPQVSFKSVRATRGKVKRAEPVAALYAQKKVCHVLHGLDDLENQMVEFTTDFDVDVMGYSPDRVDALVWGLTELMLTAQMGLAQIGVQGT